MHAPSGELQELLARLVSRANEPETRVIYRGERKCFPRISSGLYRELHQIDDHYFDIGSAQRRRLERARPYAPHLSDDDLLTHLQHLGGKTNLIDFTRDLNIALFFSSYDSADTDGRVILMEEPLVRREQRDVIAPYKLVARGTPANMADVQKSAWVEPGRGSSATRTSPSSRFRARSSRTSCPTCRWCTASRLRPSTTTCRGSSAIRTDSVIPTRSGTRACEPPRRGDTNAPVSYTHLTLPTKRIV